MIARSNKKKFNKTILIFIWHGFFFALTMSMLDFNTVFPALISELIDTKIIFGILYSIMLGVPLIFNVIFSYYMQCYKYKKKFILLGIYIKSIAYLGMAIFTYFFAANNPILLIGSFFFWIFLFSISDGFAALAYTDIIGKLFSKDERAKVYAYRQFASSLAALIGGLVVSRIFSPGRIAFPVNYTLSLFIGFLGIFTAALAFWFIKEPPSTIVGSRKESLIKFIKKVPSILKRDRIFSQFILVENITSFSLMILPFYMVYARETFAIDESYIGFYLLFQIGGAILSNLFWGIISSKLGSKGLLKLCIFLGSMIPLVAILITPFGANIFAIVFVLIGFIISGRRISFDPYLLEIAPEGERTVYLGVRGTLNFLVVLMPIAGGFFIDLAGYYFTFILVTIAMLIAFYLIGQKKN